MGRVFLRGVKGTGKEKFKNGPVWYVEFYAEDLQRRKRIGAVSEGWTEQRAKRELKRYEGQVVEDKFSGFKVERVKFDELAEDVLNDYTINNKKSLDRLQGCSKHLKRFFARTRAKEITTARVLKEAG